MSLVFVCKPFLHIWIFWVVSICSLVKCVGIFNCPCPYITYVYHIIKHNFTGSIPMRLFYFGVSCEYNYKVVYNQSQSVKRKVKKHLKVCAEPRRYHISIMFCMSILTLPYTHATWTDVFISKCHWRVGIPKNVLFNIDSLLIHNF